MKLVHKTFPGVAVAAIGFCGGCWDWGAVSTEAPPSSDASSGDEPFGFGTKGGAAEDSAGPVDGSSRPDGPVEVHGTRDSSTGNEAVVDAGTSPSGTDAGTSRSGTDAGVDAGTSPSGTDGGVDAGTSPSGTDGGVDAGTSPSGADAASCTQGALCNGVCVDLATDPDNCGACANRCPTGYTCGTSLPAPAGPSTTSWQLNGSSQYDSSAASYALTQIAVAPQAATLLYTHQVVVDEFTAQFWFRIGYGGGIRSGGLVFVFEKDGANQYKGSGGALGVAGFDGFAVEFDVHDNAACSDASSNHIAIDQLTPCVTGLPNSISVAELGPIGGPNLDLGDAKWHEAEITLKDGAVTATVDTTAAILSGVPLTGFSPGTSFYMGFGASTAAGASGYRIEVNKVAIGFPSPRCL